MNHVVLIGRLCADVELRYTPSGKAVANFDIAIDRRKSGNQDKETDFVPVVVWEKLAEICNEYLGKGKQVCIAGELRTRTYQKDGQKRKAFEVLCSQMTMLGGKSDGQQSAPNKGNQSKPAGHPAGWPAGGFSDVGLEDIPF